MTLAFTAILSRPEKKTAKRSVVGVMAFWETVDLTLEKASVRVKVELPLLVRRFGMLVESE